MKHNSLNIRPHLRKYRDLYLFIITLCISVAAYTYFTLSGHQNLANYDVVARLNAARKIIDSITPGVGQLGGIWLPFPQVLMLPFIWNDYLWHSGFAGYFVSGISFILGAVYLQKTIYLLTKSLKISFLIWFLFVSNVNILLLQSMAMSEMFFMSCLIITFYYLSSWIRTHDLLHFLLIAFFVMLMTLTRYEGYFVLLGTFLVVLWECVRSFRSEGREKIEGMLLLFLTVAGFGIILWCIYSALFYKDPIFWLHSYSQTSTLGVQAGKAKIDEAFGNLHPSLIESLGLYGVVMFLTNGVITVSLGILGMLAYIYGVIRRELEKDKILMFLPVGVISIVVFAFIVIGYYKGFIPHIEFPPIYLTGTRTRGWSIYADSNVRYGVVMLPCILLFASFVAAKNRWLYYLTIVCLFIQLCLSIVKPQLLQYSFVSSWRYPVSADATWFGENYDSGLVLISSARHEDFMFQAGLPYKIYIYEGTRNYWRDSLKNPAKYAKWIIYDDRITGDGVALNTTKEGSVILRKKFHLAYRNKGLNIYKLNEQ